ncbi:hypothetical protein SV7mr_34800 [Stieleria bergensis]|uniref:NfeD-like C-terminal domain-containing protein n=1 Tax=Stieleria bergensis TaxID=2528025 RepID=A0A517SY45_9BACT|nr:hypothetical protein SV7mr_34800 [Planctomycetes bacterium SV_7m_r]
MPLLYAILLMLLALVLLALECFLPTAGVLVGIGLICAISSLVYAFSVSLTAASVLLLVMCFAVPATLVVVFKLWPHSSYGRRLLNSELALDQQDVPTTLPDGNKRTDLVGQTGVALTDLLPSGRARIGSLKLDVYSSGMVIDAGTEVIVVRCEAGKLSVRPLTEADQVAVNPAAGLESAAIAPVADQDQPANGSSLPASGEVLASGEVGQEPTKSRGGIEETLASLDFDSLRDEPEAP